MGYKLITDDRPVMVFRHDGKSKAGNQYTSYSLGVSSKDADGNWVNSFMSCRFKKGVELENKTKINIKNAFPTVGNEYNGTRPISWFINDFEIVESGETVVEKPKVPQPSPDDFMKIPESVAEELPFS
ncbi:MAG: hypothetical protein KBT03_01355 [Bacteroidales bacterium]|nr:hypothetical protein [Candidatus Scybalousia scybalohippi]